MKKNITFILLFLSIQIFSQSQEIEPTFYSEISEIVSSKDYYKVKFGNPQTIIVLDTTFAYSSKILTEKIVYDFKTKSRIEIEKFKQSELSAKELIDLDSKNRIISYRGNIKYNSGNWYETVVKYEYKKKKKIKKKINDAGEVYLKYIVFYDKLNFPIKIESTIAGTEDTRMQVVNYDYKNSKFTLMEFNYQGKLENETKGDFNQKYIVKTNKMNDPTEMYWILTDIKEPYFHELNYKYDSNGNWIEFTKVLRKPNGEKETLQKVFREINYKN